jgi:hypothetical protein
MGGEFIIQLRFLLFWWVSGNNISITSGAFTSYEAALEVAETELRRRNKPCILETWEVR